MICGVAINSLEITLILRGGGGERVKPVRTRREWLSIFRDIMLTSFMDGPKSVRPVHVEIG